MQDSGAFLFTVQKIKTTNKSLCVPVPCLPFVSLLPVYHPLAASSFPQILLVNAHKGSLQKTLESRQTSTYWLAGKLTASHA